MRRLRRYTEQEQKALEKWAQGCRLGDPGREQPPGPAVSG
jgi:hypothetical protein